MIYRILHKSRLVLIRFLGFTATCAASRITSLTAILAFALHSLYFAPISFANFAPYKKENHQINRNAIYVSMSCVYSLIADCFI